jgi:hypothetical protein
MFSKKLMTAVLAIAAAGAFTGSAQASIIDYDAVKLTAVDYDFGSSGYAFAEPTGSGDLHFHHESGGIRPHLLGTLHLNNADDTCARMRLEYYDDTGAWLQTRYGGEVCAFDDQHDSWSVDLDPYKDPDIDSVRVSVQRENLSGWATVASSTYTADTHDDSVRITESAMDFGNDNWSALGYPVGSGEMSWELDGSQVTPHLTGVLWQNNSLGACARVNLRYLTETGAFLTERAGGTVCASTNGPQGWSVNLDDYSSNKIGQVTVQIQRLAANDTYVTVGSQTVSINE